MRAIALGPNQPRQFYRGGAALSDFRGSVPVDGYRPEDWVASTTSRNGEPGVGLSTLPDGRLLRDVIRADPNGWLGADHAAAIGDDPALLVKLLDAGERLPIHVHPERTFAQRHLDCRFGKTEAWVVIAAHGPEAQVHLGFTRDVAPDELAQWMATRDAAAMLANLHALEVQPGDTVLVPARMPHAIGTGVFCLELQEPTDFSLMLEWDRFGDLDPVAARLGLEPELAQACVQREAVDADALQLLRSGRSLDGTLAPAVERLFHDDADAFFRAERIRTTGASVELQACYSVLVVIEGGGRLENADGTTLTLERGSTAVIPYGAGDTVLSGELVALRCMPPAIAAAMADGLGTAVLTAQRTSLAGDREER